MELIDAKNEFNLAAGRVTSDQNGRYQAEFQLDVLDEILQEMQGREMGQADKMQAQAVRNLIAEIGLMSLQKAIPFLTQFGKRCLELAGKEAVRIVCAPTLRDGTDWQGQPFKPIPSEFKLPSGYEPSLTEKIKDAVKR